MPKIIKKYEEIKNNITCKRCYCELSYKNYEVFEEEAGDGIIKNVILCPNCNKHILINFIYRKEL